MALNPGHDICNWDDADVAYGRNFHRLLLHQNDVRYPQVLQTIAISEPDLKIGLSQWTYVQVFRVLRPFPSKLYGQIESAQEESG